MFLRKIIIFVAFVTPTLVFSGTDFVTYYNEVQNWSSNTVGEGTLIVKEQLVINQSLSLPNNIELKIDNGGEVVTYYDLDLTGDPINPPSNDPEVVYKKRIIATIINSLILN